MLSDGRTLRSYLPTVLALCVSVAVFIGFSIIDMAVLLRLPHAEHPPEFDAYHLVRLVAVVTLSLWITKVLPGPGFDQYPSFASERIWTLGVGSASSLFLLGLMGLFLLSPQAFSTLSHEDGLFEWASALCLFVGSLLFLASSRHFRRGRLHWSRAASRIALVLAGVLFLIGMEEISWMQRILEFGTPVLLERNQQGEANFHNLATNEIENLFYLGAFGLLMGVPILVRAMDGVLPRALYRVAPSERTLLAAAPMTACNWDMWNIIPIQMMFWIGLAFMVRLAWRRLHTDDSTWALMAWAGFSLLAAQSTFLVFGDRLERPWELTEYREFFIAVGFLAYAVEVAMRARRFKPMRSPEAPLTNC